MGLMILAPAGGGGLPVDPLVLPSAGTVTIGTRTPGDVVDRYQVTTDGSMFWGPGSGALDTRLRRTAAGSLTVDANGNTNNNAAVVALGESTNFQAKNSTGAQDCGAMGRNSFTAGLQVQAGVTSGDLALMTGAASSNVKVGNSGTATVDLLLIGNSMGGASPVTMAGFDKAGHSYTRKQTPNTDTIAANNGTTGLSLSATSTDEAGVITLTPANALAADTVVCTVTFATAYTNAPAVNLTGVGAAGGWVPEIGSVSTTGFSVALHAPPAVGASGVIHYVAKGL